tara:strand:+ start:222 stop:482 length:261 start_codon:yes stop_codon:yes gene_type:complete
MTNKIERGTEQYPTLTQLRDGMYRTQVLYKGFYRNVEIIRHLSGRWTLNICQLLGRSYAFRHFDMKSPTHAIHYMIENYETKLEEE